MTWMGWHSYTYVTLTLSIYCIHNGVNYTLNPGDRNYCFLITVTLRFEKQGHSRSKRKSLNKIQEKQKNPEKYLSAR